MALLCVAVLFFERGRATVPDIDVLTPNHASQRTPRHALRSLRTSGVFVSFHCAVSLDLVFPILASASDSSRADCRASASGLCRGISDGVRS